MRRLVARAVVCLAPLALLLAVSSVQAGLLVNGGFETPFTTTGKLPTTVGVWDADPVTGVTATSDILPFEGLRMAHFLASSPTGAGPLTGSNLWQLVDLSAFSDVIESGLAIAAASARFNRVLGDNQTDTEFVLSIHSFAGSPDSFPEKVLNSELDLVKTSLFTDGNVATWELATAQLALPMNTDFLAVQIAPVENVFNDTTGVEFDGHFADDVSLRISTIPEPSTLTLFALGTLGMLGYHWRRRKRAA